MTDTERLGFGALLRKCRSAAGLTQEDLAQATGLSVRGISALETGERSRPHRYTVQQLAEALNLRDAELTLFRTAARESGELGDEDSATGQDGESLSSDTSIGPLKSKTPAVDPGRLARSSVTRDSGGPHGGAHFVGSLARWVRLCRACDRQNRSASGIVHFDRPMGVAVGPGR